MQPFHRNPLERGKENDNVQFTAPTFLGLGNHHQSSFAPDGLLVIVGNQSSPNANAATANDSSHNCPNDRSHIPTSSSPDLSREQLPRDYAGLVARWQT